MSEIAPTGAASAPAFSFAPAFTHRNPAVHRCLQAFQHTLNAEIKNGTSKYESREVARLAFRLALPDLIGVDNIRDYIACVSAGLAAEIIDNTDATRLLYAAQVAIAAAPREVRPPGRPKRNPAAEAQQQETIPVSAAS